MKFFQKFLARKAVKSSQIKNSSEKAGIVIIKEKDIASLSEISGGLYCMKN
jgi:hypothetical protein